MGFALNVPGLYFTEQSHLPNTLNVTSSISGGKYKLLDTTYRKTFFGNSELETVKLLKNENFPEERYRKKLKPRFFDSRKHVGVVKTCFSPESHRPDPSRVQVVPKIKS